VKRLFYNTWEAGDNGFYELLLNKKKNYRKKGQSFLEFLEFSERSHKRDYREKIYEKNKQNSLPNYLKRIKIIEHRSG
jgi:hypothetical protein